MDSILYSLTTVGPVFLIIAIGAVLRRTGTIDPDLATRLSRLVFMLFLPALILRSMAATDFSELVTLRLLVAVLGTLFLSFAGARLLAPVFRISRADRGMFASGSTWSNVAIIGYALGEALYGEDGLARATLFSALVLPFHTLIGYFSMDRSAVSSGRRFDLGTLLRRIILNPVMVSVFAGVMISLLPWSLPSAVDDILIILGRASLPLALVAIGSSLEFSADRSGWTESLAAAVIKLLLMPLLAFAASRAAGLDALWTGSVVLGFSCPTAVSFFVVSRSLGHDAGRSAAIVTVTTVGAAVSAGVIAALLKASGTS